MFTPEELAVARHVTPPRLERDERPFQLERCLDIYESGLPRAETRTTQAWRTEKWLNDWGCGPNGQMYEGLLSVEEASFWWLAWTLTGRLGDDATRAESVDLLRTVWHAESHTEHDTAWCRARLTQWRRAAGDYYDVFELTSMSPSAAMLRVLLGRAPALAFVLGEVATERVASWIEWVGPPRPDETDDYRDVANSWATTHTPVRKTADAWRALALHARTLQVIRPLHAFASSMQASSYREGLMCDVARADPRDGAFSKWVASHVTAPTPGQAQEMVARDGDLGVQALATTLVRMGKRGTTNRVNGARELVAALIDLPRPQLVDPMLALVSRPDTGKAARMWLHRHGTTHLDLLFDLAAGNATTRRDALKLLDELRALHPGVVEDALARLEPGPRDRVTKGLEPATAGLSEMTELPGWAAPFVGEFEWERRLPEHERALLPALVVGDERLPADIVDGVLALMSDVRLEIDLRSAETRDHVPGALVGLRAHLSADSADAFARALFDVWLRADDHDAYRWCMRSVAFFGGDRALEHVVDAVVDYRKWMTPENALSSLDAIRRQGSAYAITLLGWLSIKHRAPRVRAHALLELNAVANTLGVSTDSLFATAVPDFGFDLDGRRSLPLGAETATLLLRPDGKVVWHEDERPGRRNTDEDPWETDRARDALDRYRRRVSVVTELHAARWRTAMAEYQSFDVDAWREHVLGHPVLRQLARSVLWMVCDESNTFLAAVRVADDYDLTGADEQPAHVQPWERVGVTHPAELAPASRDRWNTIFADYELVQPFPQLDREVYTPANTPVFEHVDTQTLRARMAQDWGAKRGKNQMIVGFTRAFLSVGLTAEIRLAEGFEIRPIATGGLVPTVAQIESIAFFDSYDEIPAESVPPGVYSEVICDVLGE